MNGRMTLARRGVLFYDEGEFKEPPEPYACFSIHLNTSTLAGY